MLYDSPNLSRGMDNFLVDLNSAGNDWSLPFTSMFLIFIFGLIFIGGFLSQKRRTGFGDASMWATVAGLGTTMIALLLSMISGLVSIEILIITIVITILSAFWLFMSNRREGV